MVRNRVGLEANAAFFVDGCPVDKVWCMHECACACVCVCVTYLSHI